MIAEVLKDHGAVGASAAMKASHLAALVGLDHRQIRAAVHRERAAGVLICSDTANGYYLPATPDEVAAFVERLEKSIRSHARAIKAARRYLYSLHVAAYGKLPHIEEPGTAANAEPLQADDGRKQGKHDSAER